MTERRSPWLERTIRGYCGMCNQRVLYVLRRPLFSRSGVCDCLDAKPHPRGQWQPVTAGRWIGRWEKGAKDGTRYRQHRCPGSARS